MIEIPCTCGKVYRVPAQNVGKKLQCRRCGSVHRVRDTRKASSDAFVVPFRTPGESDDAGLALKPPPAGLEVRNPLRRCPSCGTQDEPTVVICVRCGYDWRAGKRLDDAFEEDQREEQEVGEVEALRDLDGLSTLGWLSLTPFGVVLGPFVFARSVKVDRQLRAYRAGAADLQKVQYVRLTSMAGAVVWSIVIMSLAFFMGRGPSGGVNEAVECRQRLERLGRLVRERAGEGTFPAEGTFPEALEALTAGANLEPRVLSCPSGGGLYRYGRRDSERLTSGTNGDYLVIWDVQAHPDELGKYVFRALRYDGTVEAFSTRAELESAQRRPAFALAGGGGEGTPGSDGGGRDGGSASGPGANDVRLRRFLTLVETYEADDPDHMAGESINEAAFVAQLGVPPDTLLPTLSRHADPEVRASVALFLGRVQLAHSVKLKLARRLRRDDDPRTLLGAGLAFLQVGEGDWLETMIRVTEDGEAQQQRIANRVLGREASRSKAVMRQLLLASAKLRARVQAAGDSAMVEVPPEALPHAVSLLTESAVASEASAVLYSADSRGVEALIPALESTDHRLREAAFRVLDRLREKEVLGLAEFLDLVSREARSEIQGVALETLSKKFGPPPSELVSWVLNALRSNPHQRLDEASRRILARVGLPGCDPPEMHESGLRLLVGDLSREGEPAAVLSELAATSRLSDAALDRLLAEAFRGIPDPSTRKRVVQLAEARVQAESVQVLLAAVADDDAEVRLAALVGLGRTSAPRSESLRRDVGKLIARRLKVEPSARARRQLFKLATGTTYCGKTDAKDHRCEPSLQKVLKSLCRDEDRLAMRVLASHPDERLVAFFLGLMDDHPAPEEQGLRVDLCGALRILTGLPLTTPYPDKWRRRLEADAQRVEDHVRKDAYDAHVEAIKDYQEALARLRELNGED